MFVHYLNPLLEAFAVFDFLNENLGRLEARNEMFIYYYCRVFGYVSCDFLCSFFVYKTPKTPHIYVFSTSHGVFHYGKKGLNTNLHICLVDTCLISDLINHVLLRHNCLFYCIILNPVKFRSPNLNLAVVNKKQSQL